MHEGMIMADLISWDVVDHAMMGREQPWEFSEAGCGRLLDLSYLVELLSRRKRIALLGREPFAPPRTSTNRENAHKESAPNIGWVTSAAVNFHLYGWASKFKSRVAHHKFECRSR